MSETYGDVDSSSDPAGAVAWQERMARWPAIAAYKRRSCELLGNAAPVIDVGCGPGDDVVALGVRRCVGVDHSHVMCARAAERGAVVVRADAETLPLADRSVSGVRADRVLQHVAAPRSALGELVRILRPGSRVVIADPDQSSLTIHLADVRPSVLTRLIRLRREIGYRSGQWIARAPSMLQDLDVEVIAVETFALTLDDPADAFGLPAWPVIWKQQGGFTDEEISEWNTAMNHPADFTYGVTFVVVAGLKRS